MLYNIKYFSQNICIIQKIALILRMLLEKSTPKKKFNP